MNRQTLPLSRSLLLLGLLAPQAAAVPQSDSPVRPPKQEPAARSVTPSQQAGKPTALPLKLTAASTWAFDVSHGSANPLAAGQGAAQAAAEPSPAAQMRFQIRAERSAEDGQSLLVVGVSASGKASRPGAPVASFQVHVAPDGRILRMKQAGKEVGAEQALVSAEVDTALVRADLERILGTGLHGRRLEEGGRYQLVDGAAKGARPVEAASGAQVLATASDAHAGVLRFDGVQAAGGKKSADFTILPAGSKPADAAGAGERGREEPAPDSSRGQVGRASYSMTDGLLVRFEHRPGPRNSAKGGDEPAPGVSAMAGQRWVLIERAQIR